MSSKNFVRLLNCVVVLVIASVATVSTANAAPMVTFTAWDGTDAHSGIGTPGQGGPRDVGLAVNWNGPTTTVNGVTFVSSPQSSGFGAGGAQPATETFGAITAPVSGSVGTYGYSLSGVDSSVLTSPNDHLSGSSANLATNFLYWNGTALQQNGNTISTAVETLTLTGLLPNATYSFVEYTSNWGSPRVELFTDSLGGALKFDEDANPTGSMLKDVYNTGSHTSVTFTFTADPNGANGNGSMHEYAFSNFATTPEPSSFVLGGLGVVGLLLVARRRRA